jgi:hypothetical protein
VTSSTPHQSAAAETSLAALPFTGVYLLPTVLLGIGLIGAGLVLIRRRRRTI